MTDLTPGDFHPDRWERRAPAFEAGASEDLALALDGIERLRGRILDADRTLSAGEAGRFAAALSMLDAALGETVRALHSAASEAD